MTWQKIKQKIEKNDVSLNYKDGFPNLITELEEISKEKESQNQKCSSNFYLLLDYLKFRTELLKNVDYYVYISELIMKLYRKAAIETGFFSDISKIFSDISPMRMAYEINFSKNGNNEHIKYYFDNYTNWIIFTIKFEPEEKVLLNICYEKLTQHFKNKKIAINKIVNSLDIYSTENANQEKEQFINVLKRLEYDESEINRTIIKDELKETIKNNYHTYLKDVHKIVSEILNNLKQERRSNVYNAI